MVAAGPADLRLQAPAGRHVLERRSAHGRGRRLLAHPAHRPGRRVALELLLHDRRPDRGDRGRRDHGAHEVARRVLPVHPGARRGEGRPEEVRRGARQEHRPAGRPHDGDRSVRGDGVRRRREGRDGAQREATGASAPSIKELTHTFIPDDETRLLAMQSGEIDGAFFVPAQAARRWDELDDAASSRAVALERVLRARRRRTARRATSGSGARSRTRPTARASSTPCWRGHGQPATSIVAPGAVGHAARALEGRRALRDVPAARVRSRQGGVRAQELEVPDVLDHVDLPELVPEPRQGAAEPRREPEAARRRDRREGGHAGAVLRGHPWPTRRACTSTCGSPTTRIRRTIRTSACTASTP